MPDDQCLMKVETHIACGAISWLVTGFVFNQPFTLASASATAIGSILPDIDTPKSMPGRIFPELTGYIEKRWGHRTFTHSVLTGLPILAVIGLPLIWVNILVFEALLIGFCSHIILDTVTKSGVEMFYPIRARCVMPGQDKYRLATNSQAEKTVFVLLIVAGIALYPLNRMGITQLLHTFICNISSTVSDVRAWGSDYRVWVEVDGYFQASHRPVNARFEVVTVRSERALLCYDYKTDAVYKIGTDETCNIYPRKIRAIKGEKRRIIVETANLQNEMLSNCLHKKPDIGLTFYSGSVWTDDEIDKKQDPDRYQTVKSTVSGLELDCAQSEEIEYPPVFVYSGQIYRVTYLSVPEFEAYTQNNQKLNKLNSTPFTARAMAIGPLSNDISNDQCPMTNDIPNDQCPMTNDSTRILANDFTAVTDIYISNIRDMEKEILVKEGDIIRKGQVIARLQGSELTRQALSNTKTKLTWLEAKKNSLEFYTPNSQAIADAREDLGLALELHKEGIVSKEYVTLKQEKLNRLKSLSSEVKIRQEQISLENQIASTKLNIQELQARLNECEIKSNVDGKVVVIRIHSINQGKMTLRLRVLVSGT